jgi:plastocyanin
MKRLSTVALPILVLMLVGCGSSSSSSSSTSSSATAATTTQAGSGASSGGKVSIAMANISFVPAAVHARVGQTVQWTNRDSVEHNVTYVSGPAFTSSNTFGPGVGFTIKLTKAGTIRYRCTIHPGMDGSIVVAP